MTTVPAIEWVNRPTFQQVVQINGLQTVAQANGAGALTASNGKPIGFSFNVSAYANGGGGGRFSLDDQVGKQQIDVREITSAPPGGPGCGTVPAGAAHTFEFTGSGMFNGTSGRTIHVCVRDNADPGKGLDRLHVDCAGCPYSTIAPYTTELLSSGNVKVIAPPSLASGTTGPPSVVSLDPVLGAPSGQPTTLTVQVYDANGQPVAGAQVTVNGIGPATLTGLTDSLGQAAIPALPLTGDDSRGLSGWSGVQPRLARALVTDFVSAITRRHNSWAPPGLTTCRDLEVAHSLVSAANTPGSASSDLPSHLSP